MMNDVHEMSCDFCGNEVSVIGGYKYCSRCYATRVEQSIMLAWLGKAYPKTPQHLIRESLQSLFGSTTFGFHSFPKLYNFLPRGTWDSEHGFSIDQRTYLVMCFQKYTDGGRTLNA